MLLKKSKSYRNQSLLVLIVLTCLAACAKENPNNTDPGDITNKKLTRSQAAFYQKFYNKNGAVQFLDSVGDKSSGAPVDLATALDKVKNVDSRRLFISYNLGNHFSLIVINQKSGRIVHQDPSGQPITTQEKGILRSFYDTYLASKFSLTTPFDANFEDFQINQGSADSDIVTMINIEDLINAPGIKLQKADLKLTSANPILVHARKMEHDTLEKSLSSFRAGKNFSKTYTYQDVEFGAFPHRADSKTPTPFVVYQPLSNLKTGEAIGNIDDPTIRNVIPSLRELDHVGPYAYQDYFDQMDALQGPYWASTAPPDPGVGPRAPIVSASYPPAKNLPRANGYVFRLEGRDISQLQTAGSLTPGSQFNTYLADAQNIIVTGATIPWTRFWAHTHRADFAAVVQPPSLLNTLLNTWINVNAPAYGLRNTFYDYTLLNPYIHTIAPRAKEFVSTTKSPIVAKGFSRGTGYLSCADFNGAGGKFQYFVGSSFTNCFATSYSTKWVYVLYADGGLDLPQPTVDPWTPARNHPYRDFHEQEVVIPGSVPVSNIVGYVQVQNGKFDNSIYIRDELKYEDPDAFEKVLEALSGK